MNFQSNVNATQIPELAAILDKINSSEHLEEIISGLDKYRNKYASTFTIEDGKIKDVSGVFSMIFRFFHDIERIYYKNIIAMDIFSGALVGFETGKMSNTGLNLAKELCEKQSYVVNSIIALSEKARKKQALVQHFDEVDRYTLDEQWTLVIPITEKFSEHFKDAINKHAGYTLCNLPVLGYFTKNKIPCVNVTKENICNEKEIVPVIGDFFDEVVPLLKKFVAYKYELEK